MLYEEQKSEERCSNEQKLNKIPQGNNHRVYISVWPIWTLYSVIPGQSCHSPARMNKSYIYLITQLNWSCCILQPDDTVTWLMDDVVSVVGDDAADYYDNDIIVTMLIFLILSYFLMTIRLITTLRLNHTVWLIIIKYAQTETGVLWHRKKERDE